MYRMPPRTLCPLALYFFCAFPLLDPPAFAQTTEQSFARRPIAAVRTAEPPVVDGDIADAAWKQAPKAEGFFDRQNSQSATDQTIAWVLYDEKFIYVAFHARDSKPDEIVGRETIRDSGGGRDSEDRVEVAFDPFLTRRGEDVTRFSVNPLGTPSARLSGGRAGKVEWKGNWDAAARRVADGWTAEMRIPWEILNFPSSATPVTMGINFSRYQYRTRRGSVWSDLGPQGFMDREGLWTGVLVPKGLFRPKLSLLPYVLPGLGEDNSAVRAGVDARYTLTPEVTFVGSINPDFATIEGAVEGIQFSRSERFLPERRPFFLEGRDYYEAGQSFAIGRYFYSNRIPVFDFGVKMFGKVTAQGTLGLLATADFGRRSDIVARYRHDFSPTNQVGLFFTNKSASDPLRADELDRNEENRVAVLLQNARWGKFGVSSQYALSSGRFPTTGQRSGGGDAAQVNFTYEDIHNFTSLQLLNVEPTFRAANGLINFVDYRGASLFHTWGRQWNSGGFWRSFDLWFNPRVDWHLDGRPFRRGGGMGVSFDTRSDLGLGVDVNYTKFDRQTDNTIGLFFGLGQSNRFQRAGLRFETGQQADRPYSFIGPSLSLRTLGKLDIAYGGGFQNYTEDSTQHVLTMSYEFLPTRSAGGRIVVQDNDTNGYISYRNSGATGTEIYFILGDPNARRFTARAALKFVFAL